jgi:hypothetical protein
VNPQEKAKLEKIIIDSLIEMQYKQMETLIKRIRRRMKVAALTPEMRSVIEDTIKNFKWKG